MAFDGFLKLDGIKGESQDAKHKDEIDILKFRFGAVQTGTQATGGGGGAGKAAMHDIHIVKKLDASSPYLFVNCACGAHIKEANLVVRKAGGTQLEYYKIKLTGLLISSVEPYGHAEHMEPLQYNLPASGQLYNYGPETLVSGDEIPLEEVTLNFSTIEIAYQRQDSSGKADGGPVIAGWDLKANKKL